MWNDFAAFLRKQKKQMRPPQIWWRDDDATSASEAWRTYRQAMGDTPVLVAVIADSYEESLVPVLRAHPNNYIAQHGFRHANHAHAGEKKSEYPAHRSLSQIRTEWQAGKARLQNDFGAQFLPVFVPPWNRLAENFLPPLQAEGFIGVSMFGGVGQTASQTIEDKLLRRDTHIDLIDWRGGKQFIGASAAVQALQTAITAHIDPIGILTHHKIHDSACTSFLLDFTAFLQDNRHLLETAPPPFAAS